MARTNVRGSHVTKVTSASPVKASGTPSAKTHEGGSAWVRNPKGELFVLGSNLFDGEDTFYEKGDARRDRWMSLCGQTAVEDPEWTFGFLRWLRAKGNIRTASQRGAVAAVHARLADPASVEADKKRSGTRQPGWNRLIFKASCNRGDEPGELAAIWFAEYGKKMPAPLKRALADLADELYNEYAYLNWDKSTAAFRFADVVALSHPKGKARWQGDLYHYMLDKQHGHANGIPESLPMVRKHSLLVEAATGVLDGEKDLSGLTNATALKEAGMKWETASSLGGKEVSKKAMWEAKIPSMGIFALVRNLRNFDEAQISFDAQVKVHEALRSPEKIAHSRMFPYRFLAAWLELHSLTWGPSLEEALRLSARNIPVLRGKSAVLIDTSQSMMNHMSSGSKMRYVDAAAVFAFLLAASNPQTEIYGFAGSGYGWNMKVTFRHDLPRGGSVLREVEKFRRRIGEVGHGTEIVQALRETYTDHDRAIVITDMQAFKDRHGSQTVTDMVPPDKFLYGFSIGGYKPSMMESGLGTRHEMSGMTDTTFRIMDAVERGNNAVWPWEDEEDEVA